MNEIRFITIGHFTSALLIACCVPAGMAQESEFLPAVRIHADGKPIDADGYFRSPSLTVADIDGDGLNDLLLAEYRSEAISIYKNKGRAGMPILSEFGKLKSRDEVLQAPCEGGFRPTFADFDGDRRLDLVSGTASGIVLLFRQTGDNEYAEPSIVRLANGEILKPGGQSFCCACDWDQDQDYDLFVGCEPEGKRGEGAVFYVENSGTSKVPAFSAPLQVTNGEPLTINSGEVCPFVADWDRDGRLDLLVASWTGEVQLCGSPLKHGTLDFQPAKVLIPSPLQRAPLPEGEMGRGRGGRFCVVDWNSDGLLDIVIADQQRELNRANAADTEKAMADLRQEASGVLANYRRLRQVFPNATPRYVEFQNRSRKKLTEELVGIQERIAKLERQAQPTMMEHSYIWYFQRKGDPK